VWLPTWVNACMTSPQRQPFSSRKLIFLATVTGSQSADGEGADPLGAKREVARKQSAERGNETSDGPAGCRRCHRSAGESLFDRKKRENSACLECYRTKARAWAPQSSTITVIQCDWSFGRSFSLTGQNCDRRARF